MKFVWIAVAIGGVAAGGWYYSKQAKPQSASNTADTTERATTTTAENRNIRFMVSAAGEITPAEQISVRPEINGKIASLTVDIGDVIKKGEVFFTMDDRDLQIERESQDKEIERAKVQLGQAERNYLRNKQLFEEKLVSQEVYEDYRTQYELSKNSLSKAEKALARLAAVAETDKNCFPALLEAAEVCSLGQISGCLQEVVGRFRPMV